MVRLATLLAVFLTASVSLAAQKTGVRKSPSHGDSLEEQLTAPPAPKTDFNYTAEENGAEPTVERNYPHPKNLFPGGTMLNEDAPGRSRGDDPPGAPGRASNTEEDGVVVVVKQESPPPSPSPSSAGGPQRMTPPLLLWSSIEPAGGSSSSSGDDKKDSASESGPPELEELGFRWKPAIEQSLLFLAVQHGYAMTQPKTRRELSGPFFRDYFGSFANLKGWTDGGRFFTNYIAHPMQGSLTGFIQIQNDPRGMRRKFGRSGAYWRSRLKAMGWAAATSTQFELGLISQASIGNVGKARKLTYVDLVITPTAGTAMLVVEDILDQYAVRRIESMSKSFYLRIAARILLNPTRSCANLLRFKKPWHRDN